MDNDKNTILKKKLRKDFLNCLQKNPQGDVVDDLIKVLEKDYILIVKKPLYCKDCIHCHHDIGWSTQSPYYCMHHQIRVVNESANNCNHYFSGEHEARKSIAHLHNELTDDLFYD